MRVEVHALLFDFTQLGQRKYLKSTTVCKNRLVPIHELVKSAHFVYNIIARSDVQMIGIAKLHLSFKFVFQINGRNSALYRRRSSHVHKYRRLYRSMNSFKLPLRAAPSCLSNVNINSPLSFYYIRRQPADCGIFRNYQRHCFIFVKDRYPLTFSDSRK